MSTSEENLLHELQHLKTKNQLMANDLVNLQTKLSQLRDEVSKHKKKRLSTTKENKELKEDNKRLNSIIQALQQQQIQYGVAKYGPSDDLSGQSANNLSASSPNLPVHAHPSGPTGMQASSSGSHISSSGPTSVSAPRSMMIPRPMPPSSSPPGAPQSERIPLSSSERTSLSSSGQLSMSPPVSFYGSAPVNYLNPGQPMPLPKMPNTMNHSSSQDNIASASSQSGFLNSSSNSIPVHHGTSRVGAGMVSSGSNPNLAPGAASSGNIFGKPNDILYAQDSSIRAASFRSLVEMLPSSDTSYMETFLMTYRAFCRPEELLSHMTNLWDQASYFALQQLQQGVSDDPGVKVFRFKWMNVIRKWIEKHGNDFDEQLLQRVWKFLDTTFAEGLVSQTTHEKLIKLIRHKLERTSKKVLHNNDCNAPEPILPSQDLQSLDLTAIDPLEVARQITLMDEQAFKSIMPSECMNQAWGKPTCHEVSPNIMKMIGRFNAVSTWAARLIVSEPVLKQRKSIMNRIIKIAQRLRELHNYHSLMALIAALESAPVTRMKKTWEAIDSAYVKQFQELKTTMSSEGSYKSYRAIIKNEDPPAIPYMGVYLADLTFIEDGNPNTITDDQNRELVNFAKMKMLSGVIEDINMYQQEPYKLVPLPKIQMLLMEEEEKKSTDKELFDLSLRSEPRVPQK